MRCPFQHRQSFFDGLNRVWDLVPPTKNTKHNIWKTMLFGPRKNKNGMHLDLAFIVQFTSGPYKKGRSQNASLAKQKQKGRNPKSPGNPHPVIPTGRAENQNDYLVQKGYKRWTHKTQAGKQVLAIHVDICKDIYIYTHTLLEDICSGVSPHPTFSNNRVSPHDTFSTTHPRKTKEHIPKQGETSFAKLMPNNW